MFFEDNKSESESKLEYLTFTDFGERSDNLDYFTFIDLRGAFYYRSYSYLIITSIIYLYLSIFFKIFFFILLYNFLLWNNYYQSDIDSLHGQADHDTAEGEALPFVSEEKDFIDPALLFFYDLFGLFITDADDMITCCDDIFNFDIFSHFICINKSCNLLIKVIKFEMSSDITNNSKQIIINKADKHYLLNYYNNLIINFTETNLLNYYNNYYNNLNLIYKKKTYKFLFLQINLYSQDTSKDYLVDFNRFINKNK